MKTHQPRKALGNITNKVANKGNSTTAKDKVDRYRAITQTRIYVDPPSKFVQERRSPSKAITQPKEHNDMKDEALVPPIEKSWIYQPSSPKLLPNEDIDVSLIRHFPVVNFASLIPDVDQLLEFEPLETDFN